MQHLLTSQLALLFLGMLLTQWTKAEFLSPGAFQNLTIRKISVSQDCDDEFACRIGSFNSTNCKDQGVCEEAIDCNGREKFPSVEHPLVDWQSSLSGTDTPGCTLVSGQPRNPPNVIFSSADSRTLVVNGSLADLSPCYTQRAEPLNSSFSLVFWLRADCRNCSVLEIPVANAESIHLRVVNNALCISADCPVVLTAGQWKLISLRAFMNELTFYAGEERVNFPQSLLGDVTVQNLYIGSSEIIPMADIFELYDVRYYDDALNTREISFLKTNMEDIVLGNCRCPSAFPDVVDSDNGFCTNGSSTTPRFNTTIHFNSPEVVLDERMDTKWASSERGVITLTLDLVRSFQIKSLRVIFASILPSRMESTFMFDGMDTETHNYTCSGSECTVDLSQLESPQTMEEYKELRAETIKIILHRTGNDKESFVISEIFVEGRCDCEGSATSCTYDQEGDYTCNCDGRTNTKGASCSMCKLNFFKSPDQFGCPSPCPCDPAGVLNTTDMCDQLTGRCTCKSNVEGEACDRCKPFTYGLETTNPEGCTDCGCNKTGALSCSNTTGECQCRDNTVSDQCDRCSDGTYSFADGCKPCGCSAGGTQGQRTDCSDTGQCYCKENVMGLKCDKCKPGFYDLSPTYVPGCKPCSCHPVGAENSSCDLVTGQCPCRGNVFTNLACSPVLSSMDPAFGPDIGGTQVTIKGQLLGTNSHSISVMLGNEVQQILERNDNVIVFASKNYDVSKNSGDKTPSLSIDWAGNGNADNYPFTFNYRNNPVLDVSKNAQVVTYRRGGCPVEVYGSNIQNVKYPRLEITNTGKAAHVVCSHNSDRLMCLTPDISGILNSAGTNNFQMRVLLDGVTSNRNVIVLTDPVVNDAGNIKFQYPFEETVTLSGNNLLSSCQVSVLLGVVSCELKRVTATEIEFAPPKSPPGGRMKQIIEVHIGTTKFSVGTLQYLELYETTVFIIIAGCVGGAILLALIVVIICCCCRRRRDHPPPKTNSSTVLKNGNGSSHYKETAEVDSRPMNTYSELITLVDAPDAPATSNGYNSPIQMEVVVKEHKKGIVNTEAEDAVLAEEFLPRVEPGIRDDVRRCYIGTGHFVTGRKCYTRGDHSQLVDGTLQKNGAPVQKLIIKSVTDSLQEHDLPAWATLALSECLRLQRFKHNHVLSIIGIGGNRHQFQILYPYMAQGILKSIISDTNRDFSVRQLLGFSQQVAEGINFLSSKDVTHKDVAARNCMIDEYSVVKLSDASFAWDFYPNEYVYDSSRERYLPIRWMAPESLTDGYYDMRTDVWSFAVLVWELLTRGCLPFHEVTDSSGVSEYILQGYILGRPDTLSVDVYELLRSCWAPENESRPSIAAVSRTLSDILEAEDDETYANAGELASFEHQHSSGLAATPRQHNGGNGGNGGGSAGGNFYSTTKLSRV